VIHIDTHVAVWLLAGRHRLSRDAIRLVEKGECVISPASLVEIEGLFEVRRVAEDANTIFRHLRHQYRLSLSEGSFAEICAIARTFAWTRDPFDRLIVANAMADGAPLITADETILANFRDAVW
jgi:PIN domain nuclease of toxin-antitoxin system